MVENTRVRGRLARDRRRALCVASDRERLFPVHLFRIFAPHARRARGVTGRDNGGIGLGLDLGKAGVDQLLLHLRLDGGALLLGRFHGIAEHSGLRRHKFGVEVANLLFPRLGRVEIIFRLGADFRDFQAFLFQQRRQFVQERARRCHGLLAVGDALGRAIERRRDRTRPARQGDEALGELAGAIRALRIRVG